LDEGLPGILDGLGIPRQVGYAGMLRIINLTGLLQKLKLDKIEIEAKEEEAIFLQGVKFTRREIIKLIFGPERVSDFAKDLFQYPFISGL